MEINICPQWVLARFGLRASDQRHVGIFLSTLCALLAAPLLIHLPHFCIMQKVFHLPCPGCGILHSLSALLSLDFGRAVHFNPAGIVLAAVFCFQIAARPIAVVWKRTSVTIEKLSRAGSCLAVASLFAVWIGRLL